MNVFDDALHVITRFRKRNALNPINRVHIGITRVAMQLDPASHAAPAGVIAGERHDPGAGIFLQQRAEFGRPHLRIIDGIGDEPFPIVGDAESLGRIAPGLRRDLHQADGVGERFVLLVEPALNACH